MSDSLKDILRTSLSGVLHDTLAQNNMAPSHRHPPGMKANTLSARKSAVMIILYGNADTLSLLYIKRPDYDGHHGGQMAFPGGKAENTDQSIQETAIRECFEEVGVKIAPSDIVGTLSPLHIPVSNLDVYPFVAYFPQLPEQHLDAREVAFTISAQLSQLTQPETICTKEILINNVIVKIPYYSVSGQEIWGATAMITAELLAMLADM